MTDSFIDEWMNEWMKYDDQKLNKYVTLLFIKVIQIQTLKLLTDLWSN